MSSNNTAVDQLNAAFEEFKNTHTKELDEVKKYGEALADTTEKLDKIQNAMDGFQATLDDMALKGAAGALGGAQSDDGLTEQQREYAAMFNKFARTGEGESQVKAAAMDIKAAVNIGTESEGGYLAPVEWDRTITDARVEVSNMRTYAAVNPTSIRGFRKMYNLHGVTSGWVGEKSPRPETGTPETKPYDFSHGEIYANPAATQTALDDVAFDVAAWLAEEVALEFAVQEGNAFINGDGVNKPRGLLQYTQAIEDALTADKRHPLGAIKTVKSGDASKLTADGLIDLAFDLPADRQGGAEYYAARTAIREMRKFKDSNGAYLWAAPLEAGRPSTFNGSGVRELTGLPDVAANAIPVLFGNMKKTYAILDRYSLRVLRDPYTNKPYVHFYTTQRVGGGVMNPEYMRYHQIAA